MGQDRCVSRPCRTQARQGRVGLGEPGGGSEVRARQQVAGSGAPDTTSFQISPFTLAGKSLKPKLHTKSPIKAEIYQLHVVM